ncbi:MAG TPA: hypothetical protein VMT72_09555, partial [Pseudolabrys sp.]|nr:hypothetical protein [Pseudolabrys sp.]
IEYFIETTSAYLSGRSAFFTDDFLRSQFLTQITDQTDDVRSSGVKRTLRLHVQASFLAKAYSHN